MESAIPTLIFENYFQPRVVKTEMVNGLLQQRIQESIGASVPPASAKFCVCILPDLAPTLALPANTVESLPDTSELLLAPKPPWVASPLC